MRNQSVENRKPLQPGKKLQNLFFDPNESEISNLPQIKEKKRCLRKKKYYLDYENCRHQPWLYFIRANFGEDLEIFADIRPTDKRSIPRKEKIVELFYLLNCHPELQNAKKRIILIRALFVILEIISFLLFSIGLNLLAQIDSISKEISIGIAALGLFLMLIGILIFVVFLVPKSIKKFERVRRLYILEYSHDHFSQDSDMKIICPKTGPFFLMLYSQKNFPFLNKVYEKKNSYNFLRRSAPLDEIEWTTDSEKGTNVLNESIFM